MLTHMAVQISAEGKSVLAEPAAKRSIVLFTMTAKTIILLRRFCVRRYALFILVIHSLGESF